MNDTHKRATFERSIEVTLMVERLDRCQPGEMVSYEELSRIALVDVQHEGRSKLDSARRILQNEKEKLFEPLIGKGLKFLTDEGIADCGPGRVLRLNRLAKRALKKQMLSDPKKLPPDKALKNNAVLSVLGLAVISTQETKLKSIEVAVRKTQQKLDLGETFKAISGGDKPPEANAT